MPTNLYGPGDNYDLRERRMSSPRSFAKYTKPKPIEKERLSFGGAERQNGNSFTVMIWWCAFFSMNLNEQTFNPFVLREANPPLINIGSGKDESIRELAELVAEVVGYEGELVVDPRSRTARHASSSILLGSVLWDGGQL